MPLSLSNLGSPVPHCLVLSPISPSVAQAALPRSPQFQASRGKGPYPWALPYSPFPLMNQWRGGCCCVVTSPISPFLGNCGLPESQGREISLYLDRLEITALGSEIRREEEAGILGRQSPHTSL